MESTLYNVVTDDTARSDDAVQQQLIDALSAGAPWIDEM